MGRTCDIIGCTNSNYKTEKMSYHSLPSDQLLRQKWMDAIDANGGLRQSWKTKKKIHNCDNTFICGDHFSEDCYISTSKQKHLKPTAVPTFPPSLKRHKENDSSDDVRHVFDESSLLWTPESFRDESSTKSKQVSKSKKKKALQTSRNPVLSETMSTSSGQHRNDMTISCVNYAKEAMFIIEKCSSSQTQSIAGTVEHLERDIEFGFRTLEVLETNLQRVFTDKQELELEKSLTDLIEKQEEAQRQLAYRREQKLTKEMAWTEEQKSVFELQQNLLNDDNNTEHLREMEKILSEREEEIKQLRIFSCNEIFVLEEKLKDIERRISEYRNSRLTKLEELFNQESTLQIKKKDLIEELKPKVNTVKVLETQLVENKAIERLDKLDRYAVSQVESLNITNNCCLLSD